MSTKDYFTQRYQKMISDFDLFLSSLERKHEVVLRPNKIKFPELDYAQSLGKYTKLDQEPLKKLDFYLDNYALTANEKFSLGGSLEHTLGHFYSQSLSSQLAVDFLDPQAGESVLDLCAAPGGKTVLIAERMQNQGMIVANEIYRHRNIALKANLDRMGVMNCVVTSYNGIEFPMTKQFDKVLLDGPCSAEGTLNFIDNKELPFKNDNEFRKGLVRTQQKLILKAFELLKEGGEMVYSTCTYAPEENESVVQYLLNQTTAKLVDMDSKVIDTSIQDQLSDGIKEWNGEKFDQSMRFVKRVYPHKIQTGGFFIAKISK